MSRECYVEVVGVDSGESGPSVMLWSPQRRCGPLPHVKSACSLADSRATICSVLMARHRFHRPTLSQVSLQRRRGPAALVDSAPHQAETGHARILHESSCLQYAGVLLRRAGTRYRWHRVGHI